MPIRYRARMILGERGVHTDAALVVDGDRIVGIDHGPADVELGDVALVPGQVNAHSHAFQRALRGATEYLQADRAEEDFWSWRDLMYRTALSLDEDAVEVVSRMAFLEMALAGITTVGEFHYLHHQPDGRPYPDPNRLARRVIAAAREVGLRIVLLRVIYQRAGFDRPALPEQRRFVDGDLDTALARVADLQRDVADDPQVTVGVAPHSVRAVPADWFRPIADFAAARDLPVHVHACEQRAELEACRAAHGVEPVSLLERHGLLGPRVTLVHATHLDAAGLDAVARHRPTVCACPTTERNLGDGFLPARELLARDVPIALGSDSQAEIDPWGELRLVEYHERLRAERRNVLAESHARWCPPPDDGRLAPADLVWPMGSAHGARALGLDVGVLAPGRPADFVALDLAHPTLAGTAPARLRSDLVFACTPAAVRDVFVGGQRVVEEGRHLQQGDWISAWRKTRARLPG